MNAASLAELQRRLPAAQATQQRAAAAVPQPNGSTAGKGSGGVAPAAGSHDSGSGGAVTTGAAAAIESDFSEASAVLHPPQPAATAGASDHPAAAGPSAHPAAGSPAHVARFRPNLLVEGPPAFAEDGWRSVQIGGLSFNVTGVQKALHTGD